ncbi:MAG: MarR family winged helix-turn-helix transcriptional regulator [Deltaproteobacteria bacterium]|jgi:DNA-binding MarR family transcriptional regulator|nr:MarR family winged helix-turn-helix transcriptional regulator [Deltaproteobacteria bacterium]
MAEPDKIFAKPCYCTSLRKTARAVTKFYDAALEESGIRVTQYALLSHLSRLGPVSMRELSESVNLERTTLLRNLHPLARHGLVRVESGPSSRAHRISLTEEGAAELESTRPHWEKAQNKIHLALDAEERELLNRLLQKLRNIVA